MKLIVGLCNPEERFRWTRHNAGAMVVDSFLHTLDLKEPQLKFRGAFWGPIAHNRCEIGFLEPQTYMNSSGLAFWQYDCFDARYLQAIRKAYGALAEVEDISRNGVSADGELTCRAENVTRVEWEENGRKSSFIHPDFSNRKALLKKKNGEYALMLLNYHRERNLILRISISGMPPGRYQVADVMEQIAYPDADPGKGFLVKLSPDGAALLRISRKGREQYAGRVSQQELQAELIREEHLNKTDNYSERIENKDGSIRWTMPPEFSKPVLAMECGKSRIHLSRIFSSIPSKNLDGFDRTMPVAWSNISIG